MQHVLAAVAQQRMFGKVHQILASKLLLLLVMQPIYLLSTYNATTNRHALLQRYHFPATCGHQKVAAICTVACANVQVSDSAAHIGCGNLHLSMFDNLTSIRTYIIVGLEKLHLRAIFRLFGLYRPAPNAFTLQTELCLSIF